MLFRISENPSKTNPFWRDFDRLNDVITKSILNSELGSREEFPNVNVYTKQDDEILVTALVPGIEVNEIDLSVKDNLLILRGNKKTEILAEGIKIHRKEIFSGEFERVIKLPFIVNQEQVTAKYENGVLSILLPRREEDKPRKVSISIN